MLNPVRTLLEPYLVWIRLGAVIVASLVIAFAVVRIQHWRADSHALAAAQARTAQVEREAAQAIATAKSQQMAAYKASEGFQREIETLRSRPVGTRVVRVLVPAATTVPATGPTARRPDAAGKGSGVVLDPVGETASRDISADLGALMLEADSCSAQLRGLQAWVRSVSQP